MQCKSLQLLLNFSCSSTYCRWFKSARCYAQVYCKHIQCVPEETQGCIHWFCIENLSITRIRQSISKERGQIGHTQMNRVYWLMYTVGGDGVVNCAKCWVQNDSDTKPEILCCKKWYLLKHITAENDTRVDLRIQPVSESETSLRTTHRLNEVM